MRDHIGIEEEQYLSGGPFDTAVACCRRTASRAFHHNGMQGRPLRHGDGVVGGTVIGNDQFGVGRAGVLESSERRVQIVRCVVCGYDDADAGNESLGSLLDFLGRPILSC
jgi:hypothetical protein